MNLKAVLAVVIIIAIGAMLTQTDSGKEYFGLSLEFLKARVGSFMAGAFTYGGIFGQKMPEGLTFQMSLTASRQSFFGQNYTVSNTSLAVSGVCASDVRIGSTLLQKETAECAMEAPAVDGLFEYTATGNVRFTGEAGELTLDGTKYTAVDGKAQQIAFEVAPLSFTVDKIALPLLTLQATEGTLKRLTADGAVKSSEELTGEKLEIGGFMGFLKLDNSNILLQGSAVFAKGTGEHSSFIW
jgi:hypothetical protein